MASVGGLRCCGLRGASTPVAAAGASAPQGGGGRRMPHATACPRTGQNTALAACLSVHAMPCLRALASQCLLGWPGNWKAALARARSPRHVLTASTRQALAARRQRLASGVRRRTRCGRWEAPRRPWSYRSAQALHPYNIPLFCSVVFCSALSCYIMLRYGVLCYVPLLLCDVMLH